MNLSRVCRFVGLIILLFGLSMLLALPWTLPLCGETETFDYRSFRAIILSFLCSMGACGVMLYVGRSLYYGRFFYFGKTDYSFFPQEISQSGIARFLGFIPDAPETTEDLDSSYDLGDNGADKASNRPLLRREAIAVVGLTWIFTLLLGALPFWFSRTIRQVIEVQRETEIAASEDASVAPSVVQPSSARRSDTNLTNVLANPANEQKAFVSGKKNLTVTVLIPMDFVNCVFESSSGVTGFGSTVIDNLEDPRLVPRAILFWRSQLHFMGGLGIMVLFVAILGGRSAGKALVQTEMPYTRQDSPYTKVRKTANALLLLYVGLNAVLTVLLVLEGMTFFDALCHSFGTIATGGFSTYNSSIGHFNSPLIEYTIMLFMILGGCNFTLLFYVLVLQPKKFLDNTETRAYFAILFSASALVAFCCWSSGDIDNFSDSFRYGAFQVASLMTTTGFSACDYETWNDVSRGTLLLLIFIGGCVGSTACGLKVMRLVMLWKTLGVEIERTYRPNVVRVIRIQGEAVENSDELRRSVMTHFCVYVLVLVAGFFLLLMLEPDATWLQMGMDRNQKMYDCMTTVATTTNCVGPSFGITGCTHNFGVFHAPAKILFVFLMLFGRLEFFVVFALISWNFWKG